MNFEKMNGRINGGFGSYLSGGFLANSTIGDNSYNLTEFSKLRIKSKQQTIDMEKGLPRDNKMYFISESHNLN